MRFILLVAALASPSFAQDLAARIPVGGEVMIRTQGLIVSSLRGRIAGLDDDHIRVAMTNAGSTVQVPWRHVDQLEWTRGKSHVRGLGMGALYGLLIGASVAVSNYPFGWSDSDPEKDRQVRRVVQLGTVLAVGSTLLGATTGARKWYGAPIPSSRGGEIALDLAPGDEIRIESTLGRLTGRNGFAGDSLRFTSASGPVTLPWRNVGELEVRAGRNRIVGILLGAGIGFAASGLAESFIDVSTSGFLTSVAVGGGLGYRFLTPDGWKALPLPSP